MGRLGFVSVLMIMSMFTVLFAVDLIVHWTPLYNGLPPVLSIFIGVLGFVAMVGLVMVLYRQQKSGGYSIPVTLHK